MKRKLRDFPVTEDALLPVGTSLNVRHFVPGQYVDITGITKGKGFQGGMKRHGFKGMLASHGASLSHRSIGSTGQRDAPGKVFKGKKMPGRMGGEQRTVKNVWVYKICPARNLMWVKGQPLEQPDKMTKIIIEALDKTGQRGIINKGWDGLGNCES
ncbi:hypothetical protein HN51_050044 [Arachis hypogaea]|uniref:Large ribosomal subunit protein uL3m n=2 Tax=Arachis hypogaea TaxID=3818 RepID=A0A444YD12_ARAHY|nr:hypothetical protein Ahy_B07g087801 isoform D [Arachis hypogaea]